eukprot:2781254-Pyramimonas_sp.AAC.1
MEARARTILGPLISGKPGPPPIVLEAGQRCCSQSYKAVSSFPCQLSFSKEIWIRSRAHI